MVCRSCQLYSPCGGDISGGLGGKREAETEWLQRALHEGDRRGCRSGSQLPGVLIAGAGEQDPRKPQQGQDGCFVLAKGWGPGVVESRGNG